MADPHSHGDVSTPRTPLTDRRRFHRHALREKDNLWNSNVLSHDRVVSSISELGSLSDGRRKKSRIRHDHQGIPIMICRELTGGESRKQMVTGLSIDREGADEKRREGSTFMT
jgi:hypothetical protein